MLLQSSKLFRRTFYMHARGAPGLLCYTKPSTTTNTQREWGNCILTIVGYPPHIVNNDIENISSGKFDECEQTLANNQRKLQTTKQPKKTSNNDSPTRTDVFSP